MAHLQVIPWIEYNEYIWFDRIDNQISGGFSMGAYEPPVVQCFYKIGPNEIGVIMTWK